jgi:RNA polymerase-binding transcription factor DksA
MSVRICLVREISEREYCNKGILHNIFCFNSHPIILRIFYQTEDIKMAKNKKSPAKAAKKAKKAKPAPKAKKPVAAKAKKVAAKKTKPAASTKVKAKKTATKAAPKRPAPKAAAPKPAPKAAAPKATSKPAAPKQVVEKKPVEKKAAVTKKPTQSAPEPTAQASTAAKIAANAQLNFFQMPNQRPMAHKPAKPSTTSQDKTRYSDEELKEFQVLINRKLEKAREEYKILKETLNRNNDEGTDATSGGNTKVLEDGAETAEKENLSQLAARQQKYITNLENALVRIKNGTYGICSVTGKLISKERLIAVPHTTQSIEAKLMQQD